MRQSNREPERAKLLARRMKLPEPQPGYDEQALSFMREVALARANVLANLFTGAIDHRRKKLI